uniref:Uncharacterized protein n=1 Tax=Odontella aurita TaxID=265563 RepID=A0A7S4NG16_9STRA|mmetsp:Transcript_6483/g.19111  ORF Transcript_6483/g.19111 Transcript_6483/m.19111 type:complete len:545 (+) Transcript_6483:384-2018(+)
MPSSFTHSWSGSDFLLCSPSTQAIVAFSPDIRDEEQDIFPLRQTRATIVPEGNNEAVSVAAEDERNGVDAAILGGSVERGTSNVQGDQFRTDADDGDDDDASCESSASAHASSPAPPALLLLFLLSSIGASLPYISALSSLVPLSAAYGENSFVLLNLAVYVPLLPVSLLQARFDHEYDAQVGSYRAFLFRGVVGYGISALAMVAYWKAPSLPWVVLCAIVLGSSGAALQGMLNQMASFVSSDPVLKTAVSAGMQCSAFVVLAASLLTGYGETVSNDGMEVFFVGLATVQALVCGAAFVTLMWSSRPVAKAMLRRDSSILVPLISSDREESSDRNSNFDTDNDQHFSGGFGELDRRSSSTTSEDENNSINELLYSQLWTRTAPCALTLILTLVPSFMVGSWFTHVHTTSMALPQDLFYVRIASDLVGRLVTIFEGPLRPRSVRLISSLAAGRVLVVLAFFAHASTDPYGWLPQARDAVSMAFVAVIAAMSGYLMTGCYQLAPGRLHPGEREENLTKQAGLLNVAFAIAALVGIWSSLALSWLGI